MNGVEGLSTHGIRRLLNMLFTRWFVVIAVTIDGTRLPIHKFELERDIIGFGLGVGRGHRAFTFANPPAVINISDDDDDIKVDPETMEEPIGMISAQFLVMEKQVYYTHAPRTPHQPRPGMLFPP